MMVCRFALFSCLVLGWNRWRSHLSSFELRHVVQGRRHTVPEPHSEIAWATATVSVAAAPGG